jgi:copper chaperone
MTDVELNVPEIHCDHCKSSIESAVGEVPGVAGVEVAVGERTVHVSYDGEDGTYAGIVEAIADQGYTVAT